MNETFTGLGSFVIYLPATQFWNIKGKLTLPTITEGASANSSVVATISKNGGSAFYTGFAGAEGFETGVSASSGDYITIALTSANSVDQGNNVIKMTVSLF